MKGGERICAVVARFVVAGLIAVVGGLLVVGVLQAVSENALDFECKWNAACFVKTLLE